jgi:serine/threonine-protein kinase
MSELLERLRVALRERYTLEREVGRGGMAIVFLARDRKLGREVAIKVLSPSVVTAVAGERFLREIRITAQLQHPNILPLIDSGEAAGLLYSVMPFVEGETLRERLLVERLPIPEALLLAREVAEALDYAHRRGIIHRDIKPENILLSNGHAIVSDFGIARAIGLASGNSLTARGLPIGTAAYMSPEQALGSGKGDARSDVYSTGCLLYEMLTGRMAFGGPNLREVLLKQTSGEPTPIQQIRPEVPDAVVGIVAKALTKQPDRRYQTAGEMAVELRAELGESARVSTPSPVEPAVWQEDSAPQGAGTSAWGRGLLLAAVLVVLALAAARVWPGRRPASLGAATALPSVAVLPLSTPAGGEDDYLSEGLSEEIIGRLAQVEGLRVISPASTAALKGGHLTVRQVADTLGVRHVLDGSLQRTGDSIEARVELTDARRDSVVWKETYRLAAGDLHRLQDQIARRVAGALVAVPGARAMPSAPVRTDRAGAYESYLKGTYWLGRRTPEGLQNAVRAFEEAVALDSAFPQALAGLASAHTYSVIYGFRSPADPYTELAQALHLAGRAIARDSTVAEAYLARADARSIAFFPEEAVRADVLRARRLMPNSADVRMAYAWALFRAGAMDSALAQAGRALALDPLAPGLRHAVVALALGARRYDVALREVRAGTTGAGDEPVSAVLEAYGQLLSGRAASCAQRDPGPWLAVRAMCLAQLGRTSEAAVLTDSLARELDQEHYSFLHQYADLAAYYAWRGDAARSVHWLELAMAHSPMLHRWQLQSGLFDRVRDRPDFLSGFARARALSEARLRARRAAVGD